MSSKNLKKSSQTSKEKPTSSNTTSKKLLQTMTPDKSQEIIHEYSESPPKLLHELKIYDSDVSIKARLIHSWRSINPNNPGYIFDFGTLWTDETGMLIHGIGNRNFVTELEGKLSVGSVYKIENFIVQQARDMYRPCRNNLSLSIALHTDFQDVTSSSPDFCEDSFEFCEFESLGQRSGSKALLTDVVGWMSKISPVEHVPTRNGSSPRQILVINNERGMALSISLWGDFAYKLDADSLILAAQTSPVIIAVGGLTIGTFKEKVEASSISATRITLNPQTIANGNFKPYDDGFGDLIKFASEASGIISLIPVIYDTPEKAELHILESQRTIKELLSLRANGETAKKSYICEAKVTAVKSPEKGWAYEACTKCHRTVTKCGDKYWCEEDNKIPASQTKQWYLTRLIVEDDSGEAIFLLIGETADRLLPRKCSELFNKFPQGTGVLPPDIEGLCGQTLKFHVKLPKLNYNGGNGDFTITNLTGLPHQTAKSARKRAVFPPSQKRALPDRSKNDCVTPPKDQGILLLEATEDIEEEKQSENTIVELASNKKRKLPKETRRKSSTTHGDEERVNAIEALSSDDEKTLLELQVNKKSRGIKASPKMNTVKKENNNRKTGSTARNKKEKLAETSDSQPQEQEIILLEEMKDIEDEKHSENTTAELPSNKKRRFPKDTRRTSSTTHGDEERADAIATLSSDDCIKASPKRNTVKKENNNRKTGSAAQNKNAKLADTSDSVSTTTTAPMMTTTAEGLEKRKRMPTKKYQQ